MFGELEIVRLLLNHWGTAGLVIGLAVLLAIRFLPSYLSSLRERRLAYQQERMQRAQAVSQREQDLFRRLDRKDEILEKLTGNHIQHLEAQLNKTTEFHEQATRALASLLHEQREFRRELGEIRGTVDDLKDTVHEVRGAVNGRQ